MTEREQIKKEAIAEFLGHLDKQQEMLDQINRDLAHIAEEERTNPDSLLYDLEFQRKL